MHTLFLEDEEQASEKNYEAMMEYACENSANLEQETKTTKIVTYPLFPLASSFILTITGAPECKEEFTL